MPDLAEKERRSDSQHQMATTMAPGPGVVAGAGSDSAGHREAGDAAVGRMAGAPDKAADPFADPMHLAQESVFSVDASVRARQGQEIYREGHVAVRFDPGTRFSVRLDPGGLHLQAEPGFDIDVPGPNLRVTSLSYSFESARFRASAKAHFDVFGVWASIAEGVMDRALDKQVKPLLPSALQRPGYSMARDQNLQGTIAELSRSFHFADGAAAHAGVAHGKPAHESGASAAAAVPGTPAAGASNLVDPSAFAVLQSPREYKFPLGDGLQMVIAAGTMIDLSLDGKGAVERPKLNQLSLTSSNPGIQIESTGKGVFDSLKGLTMKSVSIAQGGRFSFDYDLRPEEMGQGLFALVALLGIAAGENPGPIPDVKLRAVRKELDARLQAEVPGRFKEFLHQFDHVLPGFSLMDIFGVGTN